MRDLEFNEDGSPLNGAYDIVSLGEYGWIQVNGQSTSMLTVIIKHGVLPTLPLNRTH